MPDKMVLELSSNSVRELARAITDGIVQGERSKPKPSPDVLKERGGTAQATAQGAAIQSAVFNKAVGKTGAGMIAPGVNGLGWKSSPQGVNAAGWGRGGLSQATLANYRPQTGGGRRLNVAFNPVGAIELGVQAAAWLGDTAFGLDNIPRAVSNWFNPTVYSAPSTGGDKGLNDYINGLYATAMIMECPTVEDIKRMDAWLTWNGVPTEEIGVPMIYTEGDYKLASGEVKHIKVKNRLGFNIVKTEGYVVRCPNGQAKAQFEAMLNGGTRFWSTATGPNEPVVDTAMENVND